MKLLNSKTILECSGVEIKAHNEETEQILAKLISYENYDCAVIFKYFDMASKNQSPIIKPCRLYNCNEMVEYADIKNGVDLAMVEGFLTFICYGSEYNLKGKTHLVTTGVQIRPYDTSRNFVHLKY